MFVIDRKRANFPTVDTDFSKFQYAITNSWYGFFFDLFSCACNLCGVIYTSRTSNKQVVGETFSCTWHAL